MTLLIFHSVSCSSAALSAEVCTLRRRSAAATGRRFLRRPLKHAVVNEFGQPQQIALQPIQRAGVQLRQVNLVMVRHAMVREEVASDDRGIAAVHARNFQVGRLVFLDPLADRAGGDLDLVLAMEGVDDVPVGIALAGQAQGVQHGAGRAALAVLVEVREETKTGIAPEQLPDPALELPRARADRVLRPAVRTDRRRRRGALQCRRGGPNAWNRLGHGREHSRGAGKRKNGVMEKRENQRLSQNRFSMLAGVVLPVGKAGAREACPTRHVPAIPTQPGGKTARFPMEMRRRIPPGGVAPPRRCAGASPSSARLARRARRSHQRENGFWDYLYIYSCLPKNDMVD